VAGPGSHADSLLGYADALFGKKEFKRALVSQSSGVRQSMLYQAVRD
jgi:hypothetical protein